MSDEWDGLPNPEGDVDDARWKGYLAGFRAAREAAAKVCHDLANQESNLINNTEGQAGSMQREHAFLYVKDRIEAIPDPSPGEVG